MRCLAWKERHCGAGSSHTPKERPSPTSPLLLLALHQSSPLLPLVRLRKERAVVCETDGERERNGEGREVIGKQKGEDE